MSKAILAVPDQGTSDYIDAQVRSHRHAWGRVLGKGPFLCALAQAFAIAKINFADECPTIPHIVAKTLDLISGRQSAPANLKVTEALTAVSSDQSEGRDCPPTPTSSEVNGDTLTKKRV